MHRLLLAALLSSLLLLVSASSVTEVVLEITDTDPLSAHELAQTLRLHHSELGLDITQVEVLEQHDAPPASPSPPAPEPTRGERAILHRRLMLSATCLLALAGIAVAVSLVLYTVRQLRAVDATRMGSVLCILLLVAPTPSLTLHRAYDNCKVLNADLDYRLYWNTPDAARGVLEAAMEARAQGWVGFGVSASRTAGTLMTSGGSGADMAIGYAAGDCAASGCVFDYWSTEHEAPAKDAAQNVSLVHAARTDRTLAIEFDRPLSTRGPELDQDLSIPLRGPVMVIYAANVRDAPSEAGARLTYHGPHRGGVLVDFSLRSSCDRVYRNERVRLRLALPFASFDAATFIARLATALKVGSERFVFERADDPLFECADCVVREFRFPNVSVTPAMGQTNYLCVDFEFPADAPYHAVRFDPIINAASSPVVHHMILFTLASPSGHAPRTEMYSCEEMPAGVAPIFVWAVGGSSFLTPDSVGFRVGKDAVRHATLQIHYNNPALGSWTDSSGARVHLTPTLRAHNAAWTFMGQLLFKIALPPAVPYPGLSVSGSCSAPLVNQWTAHGDVHVFAYVMHAHLLGRKIVTQQWRNGTLVAELSNDPYSFNYQHAVVGEWTVQRGDSFNTTCWYDTTSRTQVTRGGLASTDEMCFAILAFYCPDPCPAEAAGNGCIDFDPSELPADDGPGSASL